jgi:predicted metal-dependent phosphoesterase TrpH
MAAYKYDTHVHTAETSPCGRVPAAEMVRLYSEAGYSGLVITDHFIRQIFDIHFLKSWSKKVDIYLKGYRAAAEAGKRYGLDVILGMELTFEENSNDYLIYGIDEQFLKENRELYRLGLEDFRRLTEGKGILIFQAHPFRPFMIPASPALLDGVEVYNGNARHDSRNEVALEYALSNGLKMSSGSDAHRYGDQGRGGIVLPHRIGDSKELARAFTEGLVTELIRTDMI